MLRRSVRLLPLARTVIARNIKTSLKKGKIPSETSEIVSPSKLSKIINFGAKHGVKVITWLPVIIRDGPKVALSLAVCGSAVYIYYLKKTYEEKYNDIKTKITDRYQGIKDSISSKFGGFESACTSSVDKVRSYVTESYSKSVERVGNIFTQSKEILGKLNPTFVLKEKVTNTMNRTTEIFKSTWGKFKRQSEKLNDSPENGEVSSTSNTNSNNSPLSKVKDKAIETKDKVIEKVKGMKDKLLSVVKSNKTGAEQKENVTSPVLDTTTASENSITTTESSTKNEPNVVSKKSWRERFDSFRNTKRPQPTVNSSDTTKHDDQ